MTITYYGPRDARTAFMDVLNHPPKAIAIDTETPSLEDIEPLGFSIAVSPKEAFYFDMDVYPKELLFLGPLLNNPDVVKIAHNWMFDLPVMEQIPVTFDRANLFDTNVMARILGYRYTALEDMAAEIGVKAESAKHYTKGKKTMADNPPEVVAAKCASDTRATYSLYEAHKERLFKHVSPEYWEAEMTAMPIISSVGTKGIKIDHDKRRELQDRIERKVITMGLILQRNGLENPNSYQQVGNLLCRGRRNWLPMNRKKTFVATDEEHLEQLADPLAHMILEWRKQAKLLSTYFEPIQNDIRFQTRYAYDTAVGRLNSDHRNIQNIPGKKSKGLNVRVMLVPDSGTFTSWDFRQEHMYILMEQSGDREMRKVLFDGEYKGDLHGYTADMAGIDRQVAKTVNYAMLYGGDDNTLMRELGTDDPMICERIRTKWFNVFRDAAYWIQEAQRHGRRTGWALPTIFGRSIKIPQESRIMMEQKAVNYPILGSDGEIFKRGAIRLSERGLGPPQLSILVHDEYVFDGNLDCDDIREELEMIPGFRIPIDVEKSVRWS